MAVVFPNNAVSMQSTGNRYQFSYLDYAIDVFTDAAGLITAVAGGPTSSQSVAEAFHAQLRLAGLAPGLRYADARPPSANGGTVTTTNLDPLGLNNPVTPPTLTNPLAVAGPIIGTGAVRVLASQLTRLLGSAGAAGVVAALRAFGKGALIRWTNLPAFVKAILVGLGFQAGVDLIFDDDGPGTDTGIIPIGNGQVGGLAIIGSWDANGVRFYRLADGRLAVQNKRGRWKVWRAPKPIVLTSGGASNLRTFIKADRALDRQAKRLKSALGRRTGAPKPRCATCGYVYCRCHKK